MKAFPSVTGAVGMDLRDYFAAKAMQGILANPEYTTANAWEITEWAYLQADKMLERKESK
jgi:hypothetical protein